MMIDFLVWNDQYMHAVRSINHMMTHSPFQIKRQYPLVVKHLLNAQRIERQYNVNFWVAWVPLLILSNLWYKMDQDSIRPHTKIYKLRHNYPKSFQCARILVATGTVLSICSLLWNAYTFVPLYRAEWNSAVSVFTGGKV